MLAGLLQLMEKSPFVTRRELHKLEKRVRFLEENLGARAPEEVEPAEGSEGTWDSGNEA